MGKLISFSDRRSKNIEEKRKNLERVIFDNFLGAYAVIKWEGGIYKINIVDISYDGCLIEVPVSKNVNKIYSKDDSVGLRFYFTQMSYIPVTVNVRHVSETTNDEGIKCFRYGCQFDRSTQSFHALECFINFLYKFAEHSNVDRGDSKVLFL